MTFVIVRIVLQSSSYHFFSYSIFLSSLLVSIVVTTTDHELVELSTFDAMLTPPPNPQFHIPPTNDTDFSMVHLKSDNKLDTLPLFPVEKSEAIMVFSILFNSNDHNVTSSTLHYHLTKYLHLLLESTNIIISLLTLDIVEPVLKFKFLLSPYVSLLFLNINDQLKKMLPIYISEYYNRYLACGISNT